MAGLTKCCCALGVLAVALCVQAQQSNPIRVVLMSDTHVIGPQYPEVGTESNDVDNESIFRTPERLAAVKDEVNAIFPVPDHAIFIGDVCHNAFDVSLNKTFFYTEYTAFNVATDIFNQFDLPISFLWGNHDYKTTCGEPEQSIPRADAHEVFQHFFNATPYTALDLGPWKLLLLDSLLGYSWDPLDERCNTRYSSFGAEQLTWIQQQLDEGKPTVVFAHFPLVVSSRNETSGQYPDLLSLLTAYADQVKVAFSGHYHRGNNWEDLYPFPYYTMPAIRYDSDNFFLLELDANGTSFRFLDLEKNKGGARCSNTWTYDETPAPLTGPVPETGSCGTPTFEATPTYTFNQTITDPSPAGGVPEVFNPEKACSLELFPPFYNLCLAEGASEGCCNLMSEITRASSAAYFTSCLCKPSFYQELADALAAEGIEIQELLDTCTATYDLDMQYLGRATGTCPPLQPPVSSSST